MKTITSTLSPKKTQRLEALLKERDGTAINELLQNIASTGATGSFALQQLLFEHCSMHDKKLLPSGIEPEVLAALKIPVSHPPQSHKEGRKQFEAIKEAALSSFPLFNVAELEKLADGGDVAYANRTAQSLFEITEVKRLLYCEPSFSRSFHAEESDYRIGTGGSLRLYWRTDHTTYHGGWINYATIELINHAGDIPPAEVSGSGMHFTVNVSVQVQRSGQVIDILPVVASDESYGVRYGLCSCAQLYAMSGSAY